MTPPRSGLVKFFTKISSTSSKCKLCNRDVKTSGNTTNLKNHMLRNHKEIALTASTTITTTTTSAEEEERIDDPDEVEVEDLLTLEVSPSPNPSTSRGSSSAHARTRGITNTSFFERSGRRPCPASADPVVVHGVGVDNSPSTSSTSSVTTRCAVQVSIEDAMENINTFRDGGTKHSQLTQALVYMAARDYQPLSFVENSGFRKLMKIAVPLYQVPSRQTLTRLVDSKYSVLASVAKCQLSTTSSITLTCDAWTETCTTESFLGLTCHFLDPNLKLCSGTLGVYPLSQSHTSAYICQILEKAEVDWGIARTSVVSVVTDNGANIVKAVTDLYGKNRHLPCFAHTLALVPVKAIEQTLDLPERIRSVKSIVTYFKQCVSAADDLRKEQVKQGRTEGNCLKLKQEVSTRWNSCFLMLERFVELSRIVGAISLNPKHSKCPPMLTNGQLTEITEILKLLKPLEIVTREMSGDQYVTSSKVIPLVAYLMAKVSACAPETEIAQGLKVEILLELHKRFSSVQHNHMLAVSTLLDPRFKKLHFSNPLSTSKIIANVAKLVKDEIARGAIAPINVNIGVPASETDEDDLWGFHKAIASNVSNNGDEAGGIPIELRQYLNQPVSDINENPLHCWSSLKIVYPNVFQVAIKYLGIVATSVPSERLFSKAGNIKTKNRNRLTGKRLSKMLFLNSLSDSAWGYE